MNESIFWKEGDILDYIVKKQYQVHTRWNTKVVEHGTVEQWSMYGGVEMVEYFPLKNFVLKFNILYVWTWDSVFYVTTERKKIDGQAAAKPMASCSTDEDTIL